MHNGILLRKSLMKILLTRLENAKIRYYNNLKIFISYAPDEKAKKMLNKLNQEKNNLDPKILKYNKTGLRKLYHNLALVLHPDKGGDKKDSINLHKATTAYKEYNLGKLVDIAEKITRNPAKNSTKNNPVKNGPKHNPAKNSPKHNPVKNSPKHNPVKISTKNNPVKNSPKHNPVKISTKNNPVKNSPKHNPAKNSPKHNPVKISTKNNPVKNSPKHNPAKNSPKHNPVKNSPKHNPVKNINKIRDLTMLKPRDFPLYDHNLKKITEKIKHLTSSELFAFGLLDKTTQKKIAEDFWSKY